jgi:hypothetical protein
MHRRYHRKSLPSRSLSPANGYCRFGVIPGLCAEATMANVVVFMVPELEVSEDHVKDGLRSLLHTILFSRSLGPIETSVKTCDFFAVSYCTTNNPEEKQLVDSSIGRFQTSIARSSNELVKDCFIVEFFETVTESGFLGVGTRTKRLLWEQWKIPVRVHRNSATKKSASYDDGPGRAGALIMEERKQQRIGESAVQKGIVYIVDAVNRRVDHLPTRKLTSLKESKTYDCNIVLHSEQVVSKESNLKPLMQSLSFRF